MPQDAELAWSLGALALAGLFAAAGAGKLRRPGSMRASFESLRVPARLVPPWLPRLAPWTEIAAGLWLATAAGAWAVAAAAGASGLGLLYLVLLVRALRLEGPAACACFGGAEPRPVTGRTVVRGVLFALAAAGLTALALAGLPGGGMPPALLLPVRAPLLSLALALLAGLGWAMARAGELGAEPRRPAAGREERP